MAAIAALSLWRAVESRCRAGRRRKFEGVGDGAGEGVVAVACWNVLSWGRHCARVGGKRDCRTRESVLFINNKDFDFGDYGWKSFAPPPARFLTI